MPSARDSNPSFTDIAICGRACVLPGALTPEAFRDAVLSGRDLTSRAPEGHWDLDPGDVLQGEGPLKPDHTWHDRGGYVHGFDRIFDPAAFELPKELVEQLDPISHWLLHSSQQALQGASPEDAENTDLILATLAYPTPAFSRFAAEAEFRGRGEERPPMIAPEDPSTAMDVFSAGGLAGLVHRGLGLKGAAFALDAACASSLYALAVAAHRLQHGLCTQALVAAATRADDLFLHQGFAALTALSPSGRCRPFDQKGDGLLPAEGCVVLSVRLLEDAQRDGTPILGVIRGIGLSNDGRDGGFLKPSLDGQRAAMERAYGMSGVDPTTLDYLECHATGTPVGDRIELASSASIFSNSPGLPLGSLKAQCGHLAAAAGLGGILKVLECMNAELLPPSPAADEPLDNIGTPFQLLDAAQPWVHGDRPRRAAVSAFGFGGNNAHVILEAPPTNATASEPRTRTRTPMRLHVLDMEVQTAAHQDTATFAEELTRPPQNAPRRLDAVQVDLANLRVPPNDLKSWLPRDLLLLEAARRLAKRVDFPERTAVICGAAVAPDPARHGARWRLPQRLRTMLPDQNPHESWIAQARDAFAEPLIAARVTGTMPNMAANRIQSVLDLKGPGFTVFAEELSGLRALEVAADLLELGHADAAIVAAVDLATNPVTALALAELNVSPTEPTGDGLAILYVTRSDTKADRDVLADIEMQPTDLSSSQATPSTAPWTGHAHAAQGLLDLAGIIAAHARGLDTHGEGHRATPREGADLDPAATVTFRSELLPQELALSVLRTPGTANVPSRYGPHIALKPAGALGKTNGSPKVALLFNGAAAAGRGRGHAFCNAFPQTVRNTIERFPTLNRALPHLQPGREPLEPFAALQTSLLLSQIHAQFVLYELGIQADAVVGLSSGETNSLLALGAWRDMEDLYQEMVNSEMYGRHISGECASARTHLNRKNDSTFRWTPWRVQVPIKDLQAHLESHPQVHITGIHTDNDIVISGPQQEVAACVESLKAKGATPLGHEVVAHTQAMGPFADTWRQIHCRATTPIKDVDYWSQGSAKPCPYEQQAIADALTHQALNPLDLRRTVEQAYASDVRVFIECGPRDLMARWVKEILGKREHLIVAMDSNQGLDAVAAGLQQLVDAGVLMDLDAWNQRIVPAPPAQPDKALEIPAHQPPVQIPGFQGHPHPREPLPDLPAVLEPVSVPLELRPQQNPGAAPQPGTAASLNGRTVVTGSNLLADQVQRFHHQVAHAHSQFMAHQQVMAHLLASAAVQAPPRSPATIAPQVPAGPPPEAPPVAPGRRTPTPRKTATQPTAAVPQPPTPTIHPDARRTEFPGPFIDRDGLYQIATGALSKVLGEAFQVLDDRDRVVRMPAPPLLLADRVLGIEGDQLSMKAPARLWTETDVKEDDWFLNRGRMPFGIFIESGQADLLLISWLGADHEHPGDRVYRLLGCEVTFLGPLPKPGETIRYAITIDGFARHGEILMFFFHYDALVGDDVRMRVRHGQAGFFTDEELADTHGVLWDASEVDEPSRSSMDPYPCGLERTRLDREDLEALARGRPAVAFGNALAATEPHVRTPALQGGRMLLLDRVDAMSDTGGPWGRGYLHATCEIPRHPWVMDGHFVGDPCMPGTLMVEAALQSMQVFMLGVGASQERDGWRFEPADGDGFKLRCRGQVIPGAKELVLEVFVRGFEDGDEPILWADLLGTADGIKAFHAERMGLKLVRDRALTTRRALLAQKDHERDDTSVPQGTLEALRAVAWGSPTEAFGEHYRAFEESGARWPRLPGPPYLCLHRVVECDAEAGVPKTGASVVTALDFEPADWFFDESGQDMMPHGVLLEAALQPCGWLASWVGCALQSEGEVVFRNLDGTASALRTVERSEGTLLTTATLTQHSRSGSTTIVDFDVTSRLDGEVIYHTKTTFGFFPREDMAVSRGLPSSDAPDCTGNGLKLKPSLPGKWKAGHRNPGPMWHFTRQIGTCNRCTEVPHVVARAKVDPRQWWFASHFYEDPVQAGSIGLEFMLQAMSEWVCDQVADDALKGLRLVIDPDQEMTWRYRGQVLADKEAITAHAFVRSFDAESLRITADAWLFVDDLCIYSARGLSLVAEPGSKQAPRTTLDPKDLCLDHHRPTFTVPSLPIMAMAELMAEGALLRQPGMTLVGWRDLKAHRWAPVPKETPYRVAGVPTASGESEMRLWVGEGSDEVLVASMTALLDEHYDAGPLADHDQELRSAAKAHDYRESYLFHGPAFQHLTHLIAPDQNGVAHGWLEAAPRGVSAGHLHPTLLDAAIHPLPSDTPEVWGHGLRGGYLAYPLSVRGARFFREPPTDGAVHVKAKLMSVEKPTPTRLVLNLELSVGREVWGLLELEQVLLPKGPIGGAPMRSREPFLRALKPTPEVALSRTEEDRTVLENSAVTSSTWLPGTIASCYGLETDPRIEDSEVVALKDHGARALAVHPRWVEVQPRSKGRANWFELSAPSSNIFERLAAKVSRQDGAVAVETTEEIAFQRDKLLGPWASTNKGDPGLVEDLFGALTAKFLPRVIIENPAAFESCRERGVLFLANHQTGVESLLFVIAARAITGHPVEALAKAEHADSWIGRLAKLVNSLPHRERMELLRLVDRSDPTATLGIMREALNLVSTNQRSLLVHVEGTRHRQAGIPVTTVSASLVDLATETGVPIVPLRFAHGLPRDPLEKRVEFPVGFAAQTAYLGDPLLPQDLHPLASSDRRAMALQRINGLGPALELEHPNEPDEGLVHAVQNTQEQNHGKILSVLLRNLLMRAPDLSKESRSILAALAEGKPAPAPFNLLLP